MGLDLRLLPFDCDQGDFAYSHTMLDCDRGRELFAAIMGGAPGRAAVPDGFTSFSGRHGGCQEAGYGRTTTTPYGEPVEWVEVEDLLPFADHAEVKDSNRNRGIWAYLKELPKRTKIALYWH